MRAYAYLAAALLWAASLFWAYNHGVTVTASHWRGEVATAQRDAEQAARKRETELTQAADDAARKARDDAEKLRAAAAAGRVVAYRLRDQVRAYASRACSPATVADGSAPSETPGVVLSELFGWADARAQELAESLDQSNAAGRACEVIYERASK